MNIDERCQKLPVIHTEKTKWSSEKNDNNVLTLPYPIYSVDISKWIDAFYKLELADMNYIENMKRISDKDISTLSRDEILTRMTALIRGERFCDGLIAEALSDGSLEALSVRLNKITRSQEAIDQNLIIQIDGIIKDIWVRNISKDYDEKHLLKEDCLKNSFYYHLRTRLSDIMEKHNIRIFTEYYLPELRYRADIAIVQVDPEIKDQPLRNMVTNVFAIIELKYKSGYSKGIENEIKNDIWKIQDYIKTGRMDCQFYLAVIYETECWALNWFDRRQTNNWAANRVTELDAGFIDGVMKFEINSYNGLNP